MSSSVLGRRTAQFDRDPDWMESAFRQGVNPKSWHLAEPADESLTEAFRKSGFVPELEKHFVGPDDRVYKRSPATEPDDAARLRLARAPSSLFAFAGGAGFDPATGIPEHGFRLRPKKAGEPDSEEHKRSPAKVDEFVSEILGLEGAVADRDPDDDPGRRTRYGVTRATFNGWLLRHKLDGRPAVSLDFERVDAARAADILRDVLYHDVKLDRLHDDALTHQLMDMYTMHSWRGVRKIVYEAIDRVMTSQHLYNRHEQKLEMPKGDQPVDPLALSRLDYLTNIGLGDEIKNALVDVRLEYVKRLPNFAANPGWIPRIERFRQN